MSMSIGYSRSVDPGSKLGKKLLILFMAIGVLMLVLAVVIGVVSMNNSRKLVQTEGKIVRFDSEGYPFVRYEVDGVTYVSRLDTASSTNYTGKTVKIAYDPDNPGKMTSPAWYIPSLILGFIGLVFLIVSVIPLKILHSRKEKKKEEVPVWEQ